ncbi:hypothetical protein K474DRAFT_1776453 [Panus rudis PR-1116 ss-1]|nr:hypothetical protein K474DRAFT_1776453 [Panus rudis PR-1116 ss-1]
MYIPRLQTPRRRIDTTAILPTRAYPIQPLHSQASYPTGLNFLNLASSTSYQETGDGNTNASHAKDVMYDAGVGLEKIKTAETGLSDRKKVLRDETVNVHGLQPSFSYYYNFPLRDIRLAWKFGSSRRSFTNVRVSSFAARLKNLKEANDTETAAAPISNSLLDLNPSARSPPR